MKDVEYKEELEFFIRAELEKRPKRIKQRIILHGMGGYKQINIMEETHLDKAGA